MKASVLLSGHSDSVYGIAWAPDGNRLVSAGRDGTLRVWRAGGGQDAEFEFRSAVRNVTFSRDGRLLGLGTKAGLVEVRETSSWGVVFRRECEGLESLILLSQPSTLFAGGTDGLVHGWPLDGGPAVRYSIGKPALSIRASPDEEWLAIACHGRALFVRRLDGQSLAVWEAGERVDVYDCVIAPDGETCAAALRLRRGGSIGRTEHGDLFEIALWRPLREEEPSGRENLVGHTAWVTSVEFSPESSESEPLLASASFDCSVRLWSYGSSLRQVAELRGHGAAVYAARFSPKGDRLATCSADGTIRIWPLQGLTAASDKQPVILRETFSLRRDGVGIDPVLTYAEVLADELFAIESLKRLHETVEKKLQVEDRELGLALQQIGNVRAMQASQQRDDERVRRWRRVQSEVHSRAVELVLGAFFEQRAAPDAAPRAVARLFSNLDTREVQRIRDVAVDYVRTVLAIAEGAVSADEGRRRLAGRPVDQRAVFMAAGMLRVTQVTEVIAGRRSGAGLTQAVEVLALLLPTPTHPVVAATVFEMAGALQCLTGDNRAGVSWLERAEAAARRSGWPGLLSSTLGGLGNARRNVGELNAARVAYEECLDIAEHERLRDEFIIHSSNLALVELDLGDYPSAFKHLRAAASVCRSTLTALASVKSGGNAPEFLKVAGRYRTCLGNLASVYHEFDDAEGEATSYATAYEIARTLNDQRDMGVCLGNFADVDRRMGRDQSAEERYQASYAIAREVDNFDGQVHVLGNLALLRESANRLDEAQTLRVQAIRIARERGLQQRLIVELCNLAQASRRRGRLTEAEAALLEAQVVADKVRQELRVPEEGPRVQEHVGRIADVLIGLYLESGRLVDAFEAAERGRAGMLLDQLAGPPQGNRRPYSADEILSAVRRVGRRAVLVSYYVLADSVCIFVLRADGDRPHATEVRVSSDELLAIRRDFDLEVEGRRRARTELEQTLLKLAKLTVDPILPHLRQTDLLIVAPHRLLQGLPLHVAFMAHGDRFLDPRPVAYVPSASALVMMAARQPPNVQTCSVLGAHFIGEARTVARILGVEAITGDRLDKDHVLRALAESDVVHLSTHGFHVPHDARRSGLRLCETPEMEAYVDLLRRPPSTTWPGQRRDLEAARAQMLRHVLEASDLARAHSRARLVTLSACETGLVRTDAADDPVGLVPALLSIGVHGVVATLWKVDAAVTAEFMYEFYAALTQPGGWNQIPYALRDAVNAVRTRHPQPFNWAPVLLVGGVGEGTAE